MVAFDGAVYTLRDTDGTVTTFARATEGGAWLVSTSTPPIQAAPTRYIYETLDDQVRVKRAIAPAEAGVGDCAAPTPARGCERPSSPRFPSCPRPGLGLADRV